MYLKKKMLRKNLKRFKKLMRYCLMKVKDVNMINMDMRHLLMQVVVFLDLMVSTLMVWKIFLVICLVICLVADRLVLLQIEDKMEQICYTA